ncbi:MAG: glycosyltransferase [Gammaproteobacteria bacterium]
MDFVFYLSSEWSRFHRPGMIRALADASKESGGKILCVDNPVCLMTGRWHRPARWHGWRNATDHLRQLQDNLYLYDAHILLHDRLAARIPGAARLNRRLLRKQIQAQLLRLQMGSGKLISWFHFPTFQHYAGMLDEDLKVYECYDEHSEIPGLGAGTRRLYRQLEAQLLHKVDVVLTTSTPLQIVKSKQHPEVWCSHNAADVDYFARVQTAAVAPAAELAAMARPVIGYLGTLHEHTDLELLVAMAVARPQWTVLMVGPVQKGLNTTALQRLQSLPNVFMKGWVAQDELLSYLKCVDVCVIPYKAQARFNHFVNPNKLHEYTAMGKPIVATPGTDVSTHEHLITIAHTTAEFIAGIEAAYRDDSPERIRERLDFARENSWQRRAEELVKRLAEMLPAQGA